MAIELLAHEKRPKSSNRPSMRIVESVEIRVKGRKVGVLKNDGSRIFIKYNDGLEQDVRLKQ